MANFFAQYRGALNLAKQVATPNVGFRAGQLGAMHAVLAHESVHDDPAIVCLPTGYGKTSLMMALPLLLTRRYRRRNARGARRWDSLLEALQFIHLSEQSGQQVRAATMHRLSRRPGSDQLKELCLKLRVV